MKKSTTPRSRSTRLGHRETRKRSLAAIFAALLAMVVLLAACGGGSDESDDAEADSDEEPTEEAISGEDGDTDEASDPDDVTRLIWAVPGTTPTLDNAVSGVDGRMQRRYTAETHSGLVHLGAETLPGLGCEVTPSLDSVQPELAESWEISDDGTAIIFTLREGVVSAAGNPLTVDDVVWSFERWSELSNVGRSVGGGQGSLDVDDPLTVLDDGRVQVNLTEPNAVAIGLLAFPWYKIYDSVAVTEAAGPDDPWGEEILESDLPTFGPWTVADFQPEESVLYTRNQSWEPFGTWSEPGNVDEFFIRTIPDPGTRTQLLLAGEVDLVDGLGFDQWGSLQEATDITVEGCNTARRDGLFFNQETDAFSDERVRRAISMAIDREAISEIVYGGLGIPALSGLSSAFDHDIPEQDGMRFDPDGAVELLAEAGYDGDFSFTLEYTASKPGPEAEAMAIQIQSQLADIGVDVVLAPQPGLAELEERLESGSVEAYIFDENPLIADVAYAAGLMLVSTARQHWMNWNSDEFDAAQQFVRSRQPGDERQAVINEMAELVVRDMPVAYLIEVPHVRAYRSTVSELPFVWGDNTLAIMARMAE